MYHVNLTYIYMCKCDRSRGKSRVNSKLSVVFILKEYNNLVIQIIFSINTNLAASPIQNSNWLFFHFKVKITCVLFYYHIHEF